MVSPRQQQQSETEQVGTTVADPRLVPPARLVGKHEDIYQLPDGPDWERQWWALVKAHWAEYSAATGQGIHQRVGIALCPLGEMAAQTICIWPLHTNLGLSGVRFTLGNGWWGGGIERNVYVRPPVSISRVTPMRAESALQVKVDQENARRARDERMKAQLDLLREHLGVAPVLAEGHVDYTITSVFVRDLTDPETVERVVWAVRAVLAQPEKGGR